MSVNPRKTGGATNVSPPPTPSKGEESKLTPEQEEDLKIDSYYEQDEDMEIIEVEF